MQDQIIRAVACGGQVSAIAISSKNIVERARQIHTTLPVATAALGRSLSAASMMGHMLKMDGASLTLRINGGGPLGSITAVSDSSGNVRGLVRNPHIILPLRPDGKLDVGRAVGRCGELTVIKDLGLKEPYVGSVPILSGEIAEDITLYFAESEQIPTACALGVLVGVDQSVTAAGGYILQLMPGADESLIELLEGNVKKAGSATDILSLEASPELLLRAVLDDLEPRFFEPEQVQYRCYCSRQRVEQALISIGIDELEAMLEQDRKAEITCQFCDNVYSFSGDQLRRIISGLGKR